MPMAYTIARPIATPGIAVKAVTRSVLPRPLPLISSTIEPKTIAPSTEPRKAPTMPCQKRSGRKTVKSKRAIPIVNQTSSAISRAPPSAVPPVLAPLLAARPPFGVALAPLGRGRVSLAARDRIAAVALAGPLDRGDGARPRLGRLLGLLGGDLRLALLVAAGLGQGDVVGGGGDAALDLCDPQPAAHQAWPPFLPR